MLLSPWLRSYPLWVLGAATAQEHAPPPAPTHIERTHIAFHESPAIDLYFHVRAHCGSDEPLAPEGLRPALEAARALDRALGGSPLAWAPLDGLLPGCTSSSDVTAALGRAPESLQLRGGTRIDLRARAMALASALAAAEETGEAAWKEHAPRIDAVRTQWNDVVGEREAQLLAFHLASLGMDAMDGMEGAGLELPVYLVGEAPWPGAVTVRDEGGRGVSFVGCDAAEGSALLEVILHEATHTLDLAAGEESVLGELRQRLSKAGLGPRDRRLFDLPHTLMFVQSAESIRRVIDPAHRDYGELEGVYGRLGPVAEAVRGFWRDHLDGVLTRAEALDGIIEAALAGPEVGR